MVQVFGSEWFELHQRALLRFANSHAGRRVLRIHGKRSEVGRHKIIRIEPHAIHWRNAAGTYTAEFRTHPKYAKRLYYAFKPLWYGIHAWDMGIANKLDPALNLGFDNLVSFPDAADGAATVDGYTEFFATFPNTYSFSSLLAQAGSGASATDILITEIDASNVSGQYDYLARSFMTFDTSTIPSTSTINSAQLIMWLNEKYNGLGSAGVDVVGISPNQNNRVSTADHNRYGSASYYFASYGSVTVGNYNAFSLDSTGQSQINKGGISRYGVRLNWDRTGSFGGTWASGEDSHFLWASADTTGTSNDPKLTINYKVINATTVTGTLRLNSTISPKTKHKITISGSLRFGSDINVSKVVAPVAGKDYVYRVYDQDKNYIAIWTDVASVLDFDQQINTPGTTTTVKLARSAQTTIQKRDVITTEAGDVLQTEDGQDLIASYLTNNTVGEDTDVDVGYYVDVYVHFGGFETLETDDGQILTTEDGEEILFSIGAPLGRRVFSGWIMDYAANYGDEDGVEVTLSSNGSELSQQVIHSGTLTSVTTSSTDHGQVIRNYLAMNSGGKMGLGTSTVQNTGVAINTVARLNTILEGIQSVYQQSPDGWYWYGSVPENEVYFAPASATPQHTFVYGKHIQSVKLSRSIENLVNDIRFVGGDDGSGVIFYKKYSPTDVGLTASSVHRAGLDRQTDQRVWLAATAQKRAYKTFSRYKEPIYTTSVTIVAGVYETESIQLGDIVTFANFGNFVDGVMLQVVRLHYTPTKVDLDLGELLPSQAAIIDDTANDIQDVQYNSIPDAPS